MKAFYLIHFDGVYICQVLQMQQVVQMKSRYSIFLFPVRFNYTICPGIRIAELAAPPYHPYVRDYVLC